MIDDTFRPANAGQHLVHAPKPKLTEREVLAAARSIRELQALRSIKPGPYAPKIAIGSHTIPLEPEELEAVVALLIERHTTMITSLGITPDRPAA
jgi:hypothetical protein